MLVKLTLVLFACAVVSIQAAEVKANAKANVAVGHTTPATAKGKSKEKPTPKPKPTKPPKTPPTPKTTAAPGTPPPKPGKYNCAVCTGQGSDCKATSYDKNVDWCAKINGTVEDPKNVPSAFFSIFQFAGLGDLKKMMNEHKGQFVTMRKGAPQSLVALSGAGNFKESGCSNYPTLLGLKNAVACICEGDCP